MHFPHLDERGHARMVDVTAKATTGRRALARGRVIMADSTADGLAHATDLRELVAEARTAAVFAAKATSDLLPLCHPIRLGDITVDFAIGEGVVEVTASVEALDRTGVEMEALTACLVGALTIYARCSTLDPTMSIEDVAVWEKAGGRSGHWRRREDGTVSHEPVE